MRSRKERRLSKKQEMTYHFSVFLMYMIAVIMRIDQLFEPILLGEKLVTITIALLDIACLVLAFHGNKILEQTVLKTTILTAFVEFLLFVMLHFESVASTEMAMRLMLPCMFLYRLYSLNWIGRKTI